MYSVLLYSFTNNMFNIEIKYCRMGCVLGQLLVDIVAVRKIFAAELPEDIHALIHVFHNPYLPETDHTDYMEPPVILFSYGLVYHRETSLG